MAEQGAHFILLDGAFAANPSTGMSSSDTSSTHSHGIVLCNTVIERGRGGRASAGRIPIQVVQREQEIDALLRCATTARRHALQEFFEIDDACFLGVEQVEQALWSKQAGSARQACTMRACKRATHLPATLAVETVSRKHLYQRYRPESAMIGPAQSVSMV